MYSADGIGRMGHRYLAMALTAIGALGLGLVIGIAGTPTGWVFVGLAAMTLAFVSMGVSLFTIHRPLRPSMDKPVAAKVPTPPLEPTTTATKDTLFDYDNVDEDGLPYDTAINVAPSAEFHGTVPRAAVVDERPPPPPVPDVVRTRHDFAAKYTQATPQVREILTHAGPQRPKRIQARLADPGVHPSKLPPATMRGKCGECDTLLLAPTHRPIELECPECHRVTLLE